MTDFLDTYWFPLSVLLGASATLLHLGIRRLVKLVRWWILKRELTQFATDIERRMDREIYERHLR
jgi:hypothetical protein